MHLFGDVWTDTAKHVVQAPHLTPPPPPLRSTRIGVIRLYTLKTPRVGMPPDLETCGVLEQNSDVKNRRENIVRVLSPLFTQLFNTLVICSDFTGKLIDRLFTHTLTCAPKTLPGPTAVENANL